MKLKEYNRTSGTVARQRRTMEGVMTKVMVLAGFAFFLAAGPVFAGDQDQAAEGAADSKMFKALKTVAPVSAMIDADLAKVEGGAGAIRETVECGPGCSQTFLLAPSGVAIERLTFSYELGTVRVHAVTVPPRL